MKFIKVLYNGSVVGYCKWDEKRGVSLFNYDERFIKDNIELSPVIMPLSERVYVSDPRNAIETFKNLPPLLADALPDTFGNTLITEFFLHKGIVASQLNPLQRLSFLANRGMGALEFEPAYDRDARNDRDQIKVEELLQIVEEIYVKKEEKSSPFNEYSQNLDTLLHIGSSAGGARAKALLAINEQTNEIKAGDIDQGEGFDYYLIKFDGLQNGVHTDPKGYGIVEYIYSEMAKKCGITMSECRLYQENGRSHFMTKRFDRDDRGNKIHIQTVCGLTGIDFNQQGLFSYEKLLRLVQVLTNNKVEVEQLYRRMVFNVIGLNNDDHLKNFSFMMKDGQWSLTPAYDVTFAYNEKHPWLKRHSILINEKLTDINVTDLLEIGDYFGIRSARDIIHQMVEVFQEWDVLAKRYELDKNMAQRIAYKLNDNIEVNMIKPKLGSRTKL